MLENYKIPEGLIIRKLENTNLPATDGWLVTDELLDKYDSGTQIYYDTIKQNFFTFHEELYGLKKTDIQEFNNTEEGVAGMWELVQTHILYQRTAIKLFSLRPKFSYIDMIVQRAAYKQKLRGEMNESNT